MPYPPALGFGAVPLHGQLAQPKRLAALNKVMLMYKSGGLGEREWGIIYTPSGFENYGDAGADNNILHVVAPLVVVLSVFFRMGRAHALNKVIFIYICIYIEREGGFGE